MPGEPRSVWGDLAATALVEASPLFRALDDEARQDLLRVAASVDYAPGEVVVRQGEPGEDLFLVAEGTAAVEREEPSGARQLAVLERGAVFGEFVTLGAAGRSATVTARAGLRLVRLPGPVVAALAGRFPRVGRLLEALQAARQRQRPGPAEG